MALTQIRKEQIKDLTIDNSKIAENAAIAYSKLNLASSLVASDLNPSTNRVHDAVLDSKLIALWDVVTDQTVSGTTTEVTAKVTTAAQTDEPTDGSPQAKGVLLTGSGAGGEGTTNYKVQIRNSDTKEPVSDNIGGAGSGGTVYGELRHDGTNYNLYYFKSDATPYSFNDAVQVTKINAVSDQTNSLDEATFEIDSPTTEYLVWYNTSGIAGSGQPTAPGKTLVEVMINENESAGMVAKKTQVALDALADFQASVTEGSAEVTSIKTKANVENSLDGKYFGISGISAASVKTDYVVWYGIESNETPPAVSGTKVKVLLTGANMTAPAVANATQTAVNAIADTPFSASANGDLVSITCSGVGAVPNADAGDSEFFISQLVEGKDPSSSITVTNNSAGFCTVAHNGTASAGFTFDLISGGVSKVDFMFVEVYSYFTAPLMSFVTGMGFADVVGVSGTHNHNDLYHSRTELSSGALDNRYYTETELNGGQLDTRYFTKNDLSISGTVSSNVLDARYFTKSQLASSANNDSGAKLIGVEPSGSLSSSNLQAALVEIQGDIDNIVNGNINITHSLDAAYDDGSAVSVDATNVDFQLAATKKFIVSDSTDTSKIVVTAGTGADSVKIDTSGGIDIDVDGGFTVDDDSGAYMLISNVGDISIASANNRGVTLTSGNAGDINFNSNNKILLHAINATNSAVEITTTTGGVDINAATVVDLNAGTILNLKDANLTSSLPLSQTGVSVLSTNFNTATSIVGAINENADDLNTLITVTLPAVTDGSAGADKIGATGIAGVIPTGKNLGDDATVQEMLEGIAIGAGGGKTFADITAFGTAKAGGTYFKINEPVFILDINRWVIVKTNSVNITEAVDWDYVGDTARVIGGGSFQTVLTDTTADSFKVDTDGGISLTADKGILIQDTSLAKVQITDAGQIDVSAAADQDVNISSDQQVFIEGIGGTSTVKISSGSIDIDTHTGGMTVDVNANQNLVVTTSGTGEIQLASSDEVKVTGGDITVAAGLGKSTTISSDTLVGISSATSILMTGGSIAANAGTGLKVTASSDTAIELSGGPEIDLTATLIDINGAIDHDGVSASFTTSGDFEVVATGNVDIGGDTVDLTASGASIGLNTDGKVTVGSAATQVVQITSDTEVELNGGALVDINGTEVTIDGIITATNTQNEHMTLVTSGTGEIRMTSAAQVDIDAPTVDIHGDVVVAANKKLYVDQINITSVDPTDMATITGDRTGTENPTNELVNSGFESGTSSWTLDASAVVTSSSFFYKEHSLQFTATALASDTVIATQAMTGLTPNENHVISFYAKGTNGGALKAQLASGTIVDMITAGANPAGWTRYVSSTAPDDNAASGDFKIIASGSGTEDYDIFIDAVMVEETVGPDAGDYFSDYRSDLILTIGDNDDDRIIMRSAGSTTRDLVRINQNTVEILGNLQVTGTQTTVNSTVVDISDNEITLNSNVTGAPSLDAYFKVNRGTSDDVAIKWNESTDKWELSNDGTNYGSIVTTSGTSALSMDVAYDGGSIVTVDATNVDFQLDATKKFIISDSTDTNKVVVTAGAGAESVKIDTTGGIKIDTDLGFMINDDSSSLLHLYSDGSIKVYAGTSKGTIVSGNQEDSQVIADGDGSVELKTVTNTDVDAIFLNSLAGGIDINAAATKPITMDSGSFSIDGVLASNVSVTGADLTVSTITSGDLNLVSAGAVDIDGASVTVDATSIATTGSLVQTGAAQIIGDLNLDGAFDQTGNYTFKVDTTATGADAVRINSAGGIDVDAAGTFALTANTITSAGSLGHTGSVAVTGDTQLIGGLDVDGASITLTSTGTAGAHLALVSADKVTVTGVGVDIDAGIGAFTLEGDADSTINTTASTLNLKTTTSGAIALNSAGAITFKDSILTSAINLSQTNASVLTNKFDYNSQTAFDWTSRSTGQSSITSMMGALNANRQDLWEYVELLNTQGAAIGVAAGANLIGCDGIASIIPNRPGALLGDDGTVQEMLESLALQAGGSCKHFATLQSFLDYKGGTGAYAGKPGYLASMTQVYIEDQEREIRVLTAGTTGVVEGTDWDYLWGSERPFAGSEYVVTSSSVQINTIGNVDIDTDAGFSVNDDSGASIIIDSTGSITSSTATGQKYTVTSDTEIELNGALIDINATTMTVDSAVTVTAPIDTNVSITTSGTGKVQLNTASEVSLSGGKLSLAAGANGDLVLSTAAGTGKVDINATNAFEVDAGSASHISVAGDFTLQTTVGELYLDDTRTSAIPFSDASNTTLPSGTTSILGAIQKAYDRVGDTTFVEYEEHTVDGTDATNDYITTNIGLLPITGTFPMTPSTLRNISGNKVFISIYLNGLRLTDSEFNYTYDATRKITFNGSDNITLVSGDRLAIEVTKIISSQFD